MSSRQAHDGQAVWGGEWQTVDVISSSTHLLVLSSDILILPLPSLDRAGT